MSECNWKLHYYPQIDGTWPMPKEVDQRKRDAGFLVSCDAECMHCGYTQHPPTGGECPLCGHAGVIDYADVARLIAAAPDMLALLKTLTTWNFRDGDVIREAQRILKDIERS